MEEIKGKTSDGFEFSYPAENADDMELLELIEDLDGGNLYPLPKVLERLLGKEQKTALYDFYRALDGRVSIKRMAEVMAEILNGSDKTKNSEPSPATSEKTKAH